MNGVNLNERTHIDIVIRRVTVEKGPGYTFYNVSVRADSSDHVLFHSREPKTVREALELLLKELDS